MTSSLSVSDLTIISSMSSQIFDQTKAKKKKKPTKPRTQEEEPKPPGWTKKHYAWMIVTLQFCNLQTKQW